MNVEKFDISQKYDRRGSQHNCSEFKCEQLDAPALLGSKSKVHQNAKKSSHHMKSHVADLDAFDAYIDRLKREDRVFAGSAFSVEFWLFIRNQLSQTEGIGYNDHQEPAVIHPRGPSDSMKFLTQIIATQAVHPLQPRMLAKSSGISLDLVLTELFYATRSGLVNMCFAPECKRCGTLICHNDRLSGLPAQVPCPGCRIDNDINTLDSVKVVFRFSDDVYFVESNRFPCQPSAASMAQSLVHAVVPSCSSGCGIRYSVGCGGVDVQVHAAIPAGKFRMHCTASGTDSFLVVEQDAMEDDEPYSLSLTVSDLVVDHKAQWSVDQLPILTSPHGKIHFDVFNDTPSFFVLWVQNNVDDETLFALPEAERSPTVSATDVMHHPLFNCFFPNQLVSRLNKFEIEHVILVFTDIVGSTNMYAKWGDGAALDIVTRHFEILFESLSQKGRLIKTIGDAVMASFTSGRAAMEAIASAMTLLHQECRQPDGTSVQIRVGIHAGKALVLPVNGCNDYFGQTVNVAARVESAAGPSEVFVSDAVLRNDSDAKEALNELLAVDGFEAVPTRALKLKGVSDALTVAGFRHVLAFKKKGSTLKKWKTFACWGRSWFD